MKRRDLRDYLQDILDAIDDIERFVADMSYEQFIKDKKTLNGRDNLLIYEQNYYSSSILVRIAKSSCNCSK
jgi:hypothetical protein